MSVRSSIFIITMAITFFVLGFSVAIVIHWSLRPSIEIALPIQPEVAKPELSNLVDLKTKQIKLRKEVGDLEDTHHQASQSNQLAQSNARAVISQLQVYRDKRDTLFADYEKNREQVVSKLDSLDETIQQKLVQQQLRIERIDVDQLRFELESLLLYYHPLNDTVSLNEALLSNPIENQALIEQRFELMVQLPDYEFTDSLYDELDEIIDRLNQQHLNQTQLKNLFCSAVSCELQISLNQKQPYFDYWYQWLTELKNTQQLNDISFHAYITENQQLVGTVLVNRN